MQTRERAHCARSVFPFIKKKKKKRTASKQALEQLEESRQVVNALTETASSQEKESGHETNSQATESRTSAPTSGTSAPASGHAGLRDDQRTQALRGATASSRTKSASALADSRSGQ